MEEAKKPEATEPKKPTAQEIAAKYNQAKRQYSIFFQKTIEIEDELQGVK